MTENYIDRKEVANLLGISYSSVSAFITKYGLPYYRVGCRTRYKLDEVKQYIQNNKHNQIKNKSKEVIH